MLLVKEKEMKMKQAQKKVGFIKKLKQICKLLKSKSSYTQMESSLPRKLNIIITHIGYNKMKTKQKYHAVGIVSKSNRKNR
jgi:hypothetical protein